jgi:hypothetical protein
MILGATVHLSQLEDIKDLLTIFTLGSEIFASLVKCVHDRTYITQQKWVISLLIGSMVTLLQLFDKNGGSYSVIIRKCFLNETE